MNGAGVKPSLTLSERRSDNNLARTCFELLHSTRAEALSSEGDHQVSHRDEGGYARSPSARPQDQCRCQRQECLRPSSGSTPTKQLFKRALSTASAWERQSLHESLRKHECHRQKHSICSNVARVGNYDLRMPCIARMVVLVTVLINQTARGNPIRSCPT